MCKRVVIVFCSLFLLVGCLDVTTPNEDLSDSVDISDSIDISDSVDIFVPKVEMLLRPDSTVQIYVPELPFLHFGEVIKDGEIIDTMWNRLWIDTVVCSKESVYSINVLNCAGELITGEIALPIVKGNEPKVGLIFPNSRTKSLLGSKQLILWEKVSFPTDSVILVVKYIKGHNHSISSSTKQEFTIPNSGSSSLIVNNPFFLTGKSFDYYDMYIEYKIHPHGTSEWDVYTYSSGFVGIFLPSFSDVITYPVLNDTAQVGTISDFAWNRNKVGSSIVNISLKSVNMGSVFEFGEVVNNGQYLWTVPNVDEGFYHMKIDYLDSLGNLYTKIGYPFYIIR